MEERLNMFKFVLCLIVSSVGASHYTTEVADNFQSFRPVGRFQQHVGEAHFGFTLDFDIFEERVRALKKSWGDRSVSFPEVNFCPTDRYGG